MTKRKNAFKLTKAEQDAFMNAVTAMIKDGSYGKLVLIHGDMSHQMHSMGSTASTLRFLPWHRAYLFHMELELQKRDKDAFIPYWHWTDGGVPPWLSSFTPTVNGVLNQRAKLKGPITDSGRIGTLMEFKDYNTFTSELEVNPHNEGHRQLGKPMENVPTAPCDPIFWMHHGEVDRIWAAWQKSHPGLGPILTGKDAVMDPWSEDITKLQSIAALNYEYI